MKKLIFLLFLPSFCGATTLPHLAHSHVNGTINPSTNYYIPVGDTVVAEFPTEAWAQVPFYSSGTITSLCVQLEDNSLTGVSTFTFRINGSSATNTVSLAAGVKAWTCDTTHSDNINYGDKVDVFLKTGAGTSMLPVAVMVLFTPRTPINFERFSPASANTGLSITNGFQPYYSNITGVLGQNFFKEHAYHVMRTSGTFRNLAVYVISNARTETIPFSLWKNGADTGLSVNVAAGATGLKENTTAQVSYVAGDTVTYEIGMNNGSDSNAIAFSFISTEVISSGTAVEFAAGIDDKPQNAGETWQIPPIGALTFGGDEYEIALGIPGTLAKFCMNTAQNNCSTISTLKMDKNTATDANMVITIPASSTNTFCDNTHSVQFRSTDTISYLGNSPAGSGTMYYSSIEAALMIRSPSDPIVPATQIFPTSSYWNTDMRNAVQSSSNTSWMNGNNGHTFHDFHPDFGSNPLSDGSLNGIPYNLVFSTTPLVVVTYSTPNYMSESDIIPGGLPIPDDAICENDPPPTDINGDRHCIFLNVNTNEGWETFGSSRPVGVNQWSIRQMTHWDLTSNALRTDGITSADAAGLPILPGLLKYDEVQSAITSGAMELHHALRFTLSLTHGPHIWPGRHDADTGGTDNPPFGMWVVMRSTVDCSGFSQVTQVVCNTLKHNGMIMADNGGDWYLSGAPDSRWDDTTLHSEFITMGFPADIFYVIDQSPYQVSANSGQMQVPGGVVTRGFSGGGKLRGGGILR